MDINMIPGTFRKLMKKKTKKSHTLVNKSERTLELL